MSIEPVSAPRARVAGAATRATTRTDKASPETNSSLSRRTLNGRERKVEEELLRHHPKANTQAVRDAWQFAVEAHANQKRVSGEPYVSHPLAVAKILADFGLDQDSVVAALLHDIPEDTDYRIEDIEERFGAEV